MKSKTNLRKALEKSGMKAVELARKSGALTPTVCRQLDGGIQTLRVAKRYAAVLGCDPLELLG